EDVAPGIGERAHAAASAGARGFRDGGCFALEGFAFVSGASDENGAAGFTVGAAGLRGVPGDIDVALRIGGNGASAIEAIGVGDDVTFGFEGGAGIVEAGIKERGGSVVGELWRSAGVLGYRG